MAGNEDLELRKAFFVEAVDILEKLDADIAAMEANPSDLEIVNAVFRGLHTIKGNSSFLGLDKITKLGHASEALLDKARKKEMKVTPELIEIVKNAFDTLKVMIGEQEVEYDVAPLIGAINKFMAGDKNALKALGAAATASAKVNEQIQAVKSSPAKVQTASFVRVDEGKVNKLISHVSELELLRYALEKMPEKMDLLGPVAAELRFEMDMHVSKLSRLTKSLSGIVFGVRLVPVNTIFQRFPRVVRELAQKLGKDIVLQVQNGDAELDKNIVEAIADPMTHLIRNSADHGIEPAVERKKAGKDPRGTIRLNSFVRGNFVIIEITDDGRGIDGDKILQKAVEKGIVPADKASSFTEAQKLSLIFAPGFSTAEKVTDISGRGVGMDVVKSNINKLKGTVIIDSKVGKGTTIQLRFPMSMVVLFSLFVNIGDAVYAFPVEQVDESFDYSGDELLDHIPEGEDPKKYLALYSIRQMLWGADDGAGAMAKYHVLKFKGEGGENRGFLVDDYSSIEEAIVQSVDSYIAALPGIQGATVRKDGSVAIVLNTLNLLELSKKAKPFAFVRVREAVVADTTSLSDFLEFSKSA